MIDDSRPFPHFVRADFMKLKFLFAVLLAVTLAARAETNPPALVFNSAPVAPAELAVSLDECVSMALSHNLDLRISRYNPQLKVYALAYSVGSSYDPKLTAGGTRKWEKSRGIDLSSGQAPPTSQTTDSVNGNISGLAPWGMAYKLDATSQDKDGSISSSQSLPPFYTVDPYNSSSANVGLTLTQPLLKNSWTDNARWTVSLARKEILISEQQLRLTIMSTVTAVENAYYELIYARENLKVLTIALQLAQQSYEENKKRVEVGVMAPLDEKQAQAQVATRQADLLAAQLALHTAENTMKNLISDDYAKLQPTALLPTEMIVAISEQFNLQESWNRGLRQRPEMLQARLELEKAGLSLKYYRNQVYPQLDVVGSYGYAGSRSEFNGSLGDVQRGNQPYYTYGLTFSIPLGNVAARAQAKQGKLNVEQGLLAVKRQEQQIMVDIDNTIRAVQSTFERVSATREFAEDALAAEQKKLENGKSTSFVVLQLQGNLTTARSAEIRALADYKKALAAEAFAEATTLERRKIDVKMK
jgi:outer membrane protein TolC